MFLVDRLQRFVIFRVRADVEEVVRETVEKSVHEVTRQVTEDVARMFPRLDALSGQIEDVRRSTVEMQRVVNDDLDASNEAAALLGRALAALTASVDQLRADVAGRAGDTTTAG